MEKDEQASLHLSEHEEDLISRYVGLQSRLSEPALVSEERQDIATELIDLRRVLERGEVSSEFTSDMTAQIERLEKLFIIELRLREATRLLDRESAEDQQVPHIYRKVAELFSEAERLGVSDRILEYYRSSIENYLHMVRKNAQGSL